MGKETDGGADLRQRPQGAPTELLEEEAHDHGSLDEGAGPDLSSGLQLDQVQQRPTLGGTALGVSRQGARQSLVLLPCPAKRLAGPLQCPVRTLLQRREQALPLSEASGELCGILQGGAATLPQGAAANCVSCVAKHADRGVDVVQRPAAAGHGLRRPSVQEELRSLPGHLAQLREVLEQHGLQLLRFVGGEQLPRILVRAPRDNDTMRSGVVGYAEQAERRL
mmetsp:Transcript_28002/g.80300  ORF Transcript_28002/g.80300 Transcript_28002/m.80300 type:complete len:223 (+) Transcript_28002:2-670(+)